MRREGLQPLPSFDLTRFKEPTGGSEIENLSLCAADDLS